MYADSENIQYTTRIMYMVYTLVRFGTIFSYILQKYVTVTVTIIWSHQSSQATLKNKGK